MMHDARLGFAFGGRGPPGLRRGGENHLSPGGAHAPQGIVILRRRGAAASVLATEPRLVERRLFDPHILPGDIKLLGDDHRQHGSDALPDLRIFRQDRHHAIGRDAHEGVDGGGFALDGGEGGARQHGVK